MFDYSRKKIQIFLIVGILLILTAAGFVYLNQSRAADIQTVAQSQILANALEHYYELYNAYPTLSETNVQSIHLLTENGFNKSGEIVYFKASFKWPRPITLVSSKANYVFKFKLKNSWSVWGLNNFFGGNCRLTNNLNLNCSLQ